MNVHVQVFLHELTFFGITGSVLLANITDENGVTIYSNQTQINTEKGTQNIQWLVLGVCIPTILIVVLLTVSYSDCFKSR